MSWASVRVRLWETSSLSGATYEQPHGVQPWPHQAEVREDDTIFFFVFFFGCTTQLAGSQFPNQGFNLGHGSESPES